MAESLLVLSLCSDMGLCHGQRISVWQLLTGFNNGPHKEHPGRVSQLMDQDCIHKQFLRWINESRNSASSHWNMQLPLCTNDWMNGKDVFTSISPLFEKHTSAYLSYLTSMLQFGVIVSAVHRGSNEACCLHWLSEWCQKEYSDSFWFSNNEMSQRHALLNNSRSINTCAQVEKVACSNNKETH